ncbi:hypothetical protein ABIF69_004853 [Bradyrhizobium japonicum]
MSKRPRENDNKSERAATSLATFRVLVKQALSIDVSKTEDLDIQGVRCRIVIRPAHNDLATQRKFGGATLAVEFRKAADYDLIAAARDGFELIEDFLSAITVVSGTTFAPSEIIQVAKLRDGGKGDCDFVQFLPLAVRHWHEEITDDKLNSARKLLAHWDGLESGRRLRRAARRYRFAAGTMDDVSAFLEAYTGLEAMEKPLAIAAGLSPGSEDKQAICPKCGHEYSYKRTALVGVRALVHRTIDPAQADEDHLADWKLMNSLRNQVTHSLVDDHQLKDRPLNALIATMHYLHDAICTCSHCPAISSTKYTLARGPVDFVLVGHYVTSEWPVLEEWSQILKNPVYEWVRHPDYTDLIPELHFEVKGLGSVGVWPGRLKKAFAVASMKDIDRQNFEYD